MNRRRAFTMIELLAVIGIIMVLLGLMLVVLKPLGSTAANQSTRLTMATAKGMLGQMKAQTGLKGIGLPTAQLTLTYTMSDPAQRDLAITEAQNCMRILVQDPTNIEGLKKLAANQLVGKKSNGTAPSPPVLADAWGNPIVYVPAAGLLGVVRTGKTAADPIFAPDGQPFFVSAGADGSFAAGKDNLYSFEE